MNEGEGMRGAGSLKTIQKGLLGKRIFGRNFKSAQYCRTFYWKKPHSRGKPNNTELENPAAAAIGLMRSVGQPSLDTF